MESFDNIWSYLQNNLKPGTVVKNWTNYRGYLGDIMTIMKVQSRYIEVDTPKILTFQVVPKMDFESIWEVWSGYKSQRVKRMEITPITRYSKYIISILNWYEQETLMDMVRKCCLKEKRPEGRFPIAYGYPPPLNGLSIILHECGKK